MTRPDDDSMDDDATTQDMAPLPPSYDRAPPTIQEMRSPFHPGASGTRPGMPTPGPLAPVITSRTPTSPGIGGAPGALVAPTIVGAPELQGASGGLMPPDGPTIPEGVDVPPGSWDGPTDPDAGMTWEGAPTNPDAAPAAARPRPRDPDPNEAKIELSKSMEMDAIRADDDERAPATAVPVVKRGFNPAAQAPTYQLLPAIEREKRGNAKQGSDLPMILGLLALALVILSLVGLGVFFGVRAMQAPTPDAPAATSGVGATGD